MKIRLKNMVCDRCKKVLKEELEVAGVQIEAIELGEITLPKDTAADLQVIREIAERNGFEIIDSQAATLVEKVKSILIEKVENLRDFDENVSTLLAKELHTDYSIISKIFSSSSGITIEHYLIKLKIEKAKELLQMKQLSFTEIAYALDYSSGSHLAKQFKNSTGMSMTQYQKLQDWNRKNLDKII